MKDKVQGMPRIAKMPLDQKKKTWKIPRKEGVLD